MYLSLDEWIWYLTAFFVVLYMLVYFLTINRTDSTFYKKVWDIFYLDSMIVVNSLLLIIVAIVAYLWMPREFPFIYITLFGEILLLIIFSVLFFYRVTYKKRIKKNGYDYRLIQHHASIEIPEII